MKNMWKEYKELCKQQWVFIRRHWKGYLVFNFVAFVASFLISTIHLGLFEDLKDRTKDCVKECNIANLFKKEEES